MISMLKKLTLKENAGRKQYSPEKFHEVMQNYIFLIILVSAVSCLLSGDSTRHPTPDTRHLIIS